MSLFRMALSKIGIENSIKKGKHYGDNVEIRELSYTVGGNEDWCSHYGKQYGDSSKH